MKEVETNESGSVKGMKHAQRFKEGDVFAVPLATGNYGVGLVLRKIRGTSYGFVPMGFYGKRYAAIEDIDVSELKYEDGKVFAALFASAIFAPVWTIVGHVPDFSRETWPLPIRILQTMKPVIENGAKRQRWLVAVLDEDDPFEEVERKVVDVQPEKFIPHGTSDCESIEINLTRGNPGRMPTMEEVMEIMNAKFEDRKAIFDRVAKKIRDGG